MARLFRRNQLPESLGRFSRILAGASVILRFLVYQGGEDPRRALPFAVFLFREGSFVGMRRFPSALAGRLHSREGTV